MTRNEYDHDAHPEDEDEYDYQPQQQQRQRQQQQRPLSPAFSNHGNGRDDYANNNLNVRATFASFPSPSAPIMSPRTAASLPIATEMEMPMEMPMAGERRLDSNPPMEDYYEQEEKDAELARRLQAEEDQRAHTPMNRQQETAPQAPSNRNDENNTNTSTVRMTGIGTFARVDNYANNIDRNSTRELFRQMGIDSRDIDIDDDEEFARKTEQEFRDEALAMELQRKEQLHRNVAPLRGASCRGRGVAPVPAHTSGAGSAA
eukprot:1011991_1